MSPRRLVRNRWFLPLIVALVAILLVSLTGLGFRARDLNQLAKTNCEAVNEAVTATRDVFTLMQDVFADAPDMTEFERSRAQAFFRRVFERLQPRDCQGGSA